eukprot:14886355-Alexandrium_andersonii.AAC.1
MSASLVGSEMCIRDRRRTPRRGAPASGSSQAPTAQPASSPSLPTTRPRTDGAGLGPLDCQEDARAEVFRGRRCRDGQQAVAFREAECLVGE